MRCNKRISSNRRESRNRLTDSKNEAEELTDFRWMEEMKMGSPQVEEVAGALHVNHGRCNRNATNLSSIMDTKDGRDSITAVDNALDL